MSQQNAQKSTPEVYWDELENLVQNASEFRPLVMAAVACCYDMRNKVTMPNNCDSACWACLQECERIAFLGEAAYEHTSVFTNRRFNMHNALSEWCNVLSRSNKNAEAYWVVAAVMNTLQAAISPSLAAVKSNIKSAQLTLCCCDLVGGYVERRLRIFESFQVKDYPQQWRNSNTQALARRIYDTTAFSRMPILADMLEELGCDNVELLNQLRDVEFPHYRGSYILEFLK